MPQPRPGQLELSDLWQKAREPMFWLDSNLRIGWVNAAWEAFTGHSGKTVLGIACHNHGPSRPDDLADLAASFHPPPECLGGRPACTAAVILHASGERHWRRLEFWPFSDEHRALIGLLGVVRDEHEQPSTPDSTSNSLHVELLETRRRLHRDMGFDSLLGSGPAHRRLLEQVRLAAADTIPVLILGEEGTGKGHVARVIHQNGPGRNQPIVPFDSESLPADVLTRELFGLASGPDQSLEGPLTSRDAARPRLALGNGSTLLIREIFALPRDVQARLVACLDSSVRLIGTTTVEPEVALAAERVRPDLYYALTALMIRVRPLREAGTNCRCWRKTCSSARPARRQSADWLLASGARGTIRVRLAGQPPRACACDRPRSCLQPFRKHLGRSR